MLTCTNPENDGGGGRPEGAPPLPVTVHRLRQGQVSQGDLARQRPRDGDLTATPEAAPALDLPELPRGRLRGGAPFYTRPAGGDLRGGVQVGLGSAPRRPLLVDDLDGEALPRESLHDAVAVRGVAVAHPYTDAVGR